ncbi:ferritin-like domain-containing protein, partial [Staphylococcus epidermidis]|uniref:ferritin-like domain-containing protein n=1 Tax=Staphylococcus epidermidis TaxID=1282 RepID=UPI0034D97E8D
LIYTPSLKMLTKKLLPPLNQHINQQYFPPHPYIPIATYSHKQSYHPFPNFYIQQAKHQHFHAKKIYHYINDPAQHPIFDTIKPPKVQFSSILQTFKHTLA